MSELIFDNLFQGVVKASLKHKFFRLGQYLSFSTMSNVDSRHKIFQSWLPLVD